MSVTGSFVHGHWTCLAVRGERDVTTHGDLAYVSIAKSPRSGRSFLDARTGVLESSFRVWSHNKPVAIR
jgi:hypothetical protein